MACHLRQGRYEFLSNYTGVPGVRCFFVISGYINTKLLMQEHQVNVRESLSAFYLRRLCMHHRRLFLRDQQLFLAPPDTYLIQLP